VQTHRPVPWALVLFGSFLAGMCVLAQAQAESVRVSVSGKIPNGKDVSGIGLWGGELVIAANEGAGLQRLTPLPDGGYSVGSAIRLLAGDVEIDLEDVEVDGETIYAVGSHSLKRKRLKRDKSTSQNRGRLYEVVHESERDSLFRVVPDAKSPASFVIDRINLRPLIEADALLARFARIPGKENGIDIEGLAGDGRRLWIGFRSPVMREGQVPVMILDFDAPAKYELRFVDLKGGGIRGLARVAGGFLVIAGPERPGQGKFELFLWNGLDMLPGKGSSAGALHRLGEIPTPEGTKAEGVALIEESDNEFDVFFVFDGAPNGGLRRMRFAKPG